MKVMLASPRGFCAGVNMAVEVVLRVLEARGAPVWVFHEIVHNRHVVEELRQRGVRFVNDLAEVPEGEVLVYSAHGVSPAVRQMARQRRLVEIDATCPLVTKVHMEVLRFARDGYTILFVGHRKHDEAVGTAGEAAGSVIVVEGPEDVEKLDLAVDAKIACVTQTTLSLRDTTKTVDAIKNRWPHVRLPAKDDICYATTNRQKAVEALTGEADVVLVIGSVNSSNSQRLAETARAAGKDAYLLDDASDLRAEWLAGKKAVLVTAGASAPDHLVDELLERLKREFGAEVESRTLVEEDMSFAMPLSLRVLQARAG